jgi:hypothetical protein
MDRTMDGRAEEYLEGWKCIRVDSGGPFYFGTPTAPQVGQMNPLVVVSS